MEPFPEDFSYKHSDKIISDKLTFEYEQQYNIILGNIYNIYKKALEKNYTYMIIELDCSITVRNWILLELIKRFPLIYGKKDKNSSFFKYTTNFNLWLALINHNEFLIGLSKYFLSEMIYTLEKI